MKLHHILLFGASLLTAACNNNKTSDDGGISVRISPDAGTTYNAGKDVTIQAHFGTYVKPDSVVYLVDSIRLASKKDTSAVTLKTDTLKMGVKDITVKVYHGGKSDDASTNVVILAPKAPQELTYTVVKAYPHDTSSYTEGLIYHNGFFYESDGGRVAEGTGQSSLRKTTIDGKVVQKVNIDSKVFAEGIAIVGNKIIQLTYTERIGYVYDLNTLKLLNTFTNNVGIEGWGMTFDGNKLYMDDKTNRLYFLNKDTYQQSGYVDVYDDKGPINQINELEYINGRIFANVYMTDTIVVINPKTGAVEQRMDMSKLYPNVKQFSPYADVLNGIAWDKQGKRLFVTGKNWDRLFQIKVKGLN